MGFMCRDAEHKCRAMRFANPIPGTYRIIFMTCLILSILTTIFVGGSLTLTILGLNDLFMLLLLRGITLVLSLGTTICVLGEFIR
jgi:hypothetical protein